MAQAIIELRQVERHYVQGPKKLTILSGADFSLSSGEMVALWRAQRATRDHIS